MAALELPLTTPRLILREFVTTDLAAVRRYALDPRVLETVLHELRTEQELTTHFCGLLNARVTRPRHSFELAVENRRTGTVIGTCELTKSPGGIGEIGYMLGYRHWGRRHAQAKGRWWDCEEYEILRTDWLKRTTA